MYNINELPLTAKMTIAQYIRDDTLDYVNAHIEPCNPVDSLYTKYIKRIIDIVLSLIGLIIALPANLVIGLITYFDLGRPIVFKQSRIGKDKQRFTIYKFRNMTNETDSKGELLPPYQRVTKWGRFVRKTSLDELLNFVSVLKGDMSIIGPRPLLEYYVDRLNSRHSGIFAVRPGLECPMINKPTHDITWQDRLENYVMYVEKCSLILDVKLFLCLFIQLFNRSSNSVRGNAEQSGIMGYDKQGNIITTNAVPDKYVNRYLLEMGFANIEDIIRNRKTS